MKISSLIILLIILTLQFQLIFAGNKHQSKYQNENTTTKNQLSNDSVNLKDTNNKHHFSLPLIGKNVDENQDLFLQPFTLTSSNLPIFIINTENKSEILDEPKTNAQLKVIDNGNRNNVTDLANIYNGNIGIEIRGHFSSTLPQKPYGFETRDAFGQNNNVGLWDFPAENDWILLANYNDKTFLRNSLIYHLFEEMGHYAPRTKHCEVIVNGSYDGIYVFTEKIKIDNGRVNISKLTELDNVGDDVTGGYIFKIDYFDGDDGFYSSFHPIDDPTRTAFFVFHDPDKEELTPQQKFYLESFIESFETALYSDSFYSGESKYENFIDVHSFIDYFILGELSRNSDAFKKSKYYYKDKSSKGGLIHSGPVWDFDWAFKDLSLYGLTNGEGWMYKINEWNRTPPSDGWMVRLMQDSAFVDKVNDRYFALRNTILSEDYIFSYIDSVQALLDEAQERHYKRWDILGKNVGASEIGVPPDTYDGVFMQFKNWLKTRLYWLDNNIPTLYESAIVNHAENNLQSTGTRLFPNPTSEILNIENHTGIQQLEIYNTAGLKLVAKNFQGVFSVQLVINQLTSGLYVVRFTSNDLKPHVLKFIKE